MSIKTRHEQKVEDAMQRIKKYGSHDPRASEGVHWLVFETARVQLLQDGELI